MHLFMLPRCSYLTCLLRFQTYIVNYYTDIYFDISWEGGGGRGGINFSADCLGGSENLYGPWGGI